MAMEAKEIFEALSKSVREMLTERSLGLYIPAYQRPYGWDKDKVSKLLDDILHGYAMLIESEESFTFLGTVITIHDIHFRTVQPIVRPEVPAKVLTVIDGQQRLTSLLCLCIALHNHIRLARAKMLKGKSQDSLSSAEKWLDGQTLRLIDELASTFFDRRPSGDSPLYPRMIRSFDDQWSQSLAHAQYRSPIAYLILSYLGVIDAPKPAEFKPQERDGHIEGEEALVERYVQMSKLLKGVPSGGSKKEELEELPTLKQINKAERFQLALLNHSFPEDVSQAIQDGSLSQEFLALLQLVLLASYVLNRVAITVVRGKDEDYAFTIFESLNTTGEPLTAFETFKPKVVSAETLANYEKSQAREHISTISNYLSKFKVGDQLQAATRDLLIFFASAETGFKLPKRLADQRRYLTDEFKRYDKVEADRLAFIRHLQDTATFKEHAWDISEKTPSLHGLPIDATTDAVKLCLAFLSSLNHSVTIGPLVRFYSVALWASAADQPARIKEFEEALKAMTAFSALWRASHRGTANIDSEYRDILSGGTNSITGMPSLARSLRRDAPEGAVAPCVDVAKLKAELRARLVDPEHGAITDKDRFVAEASLIPAYQNAGQVSRFILLSAYHDAVADPDVPGLVKRGKPAASPCLSYEGLKDERHLALEHIAPKQLTAGWDDTIYENKEIPHRIGNLVLVQMEANSSLSDRPWKEKRILYQALGAPSTEVAAAILAAADANGNGFAESTQAIAELSTHMPHLAAIGEKADEWTVEFIDIRSKRILELAWDQLYAWLQ
ncbi:MAG: DUF262 domain-containing HNH endonuclease family protein [Pseudomonadota bacterium]